MSAGYRPPSCSRPEECEVFDHHNKRLVNTVNLKEWKNFDIFDNALHKKIDDYEQRHNTQTTILKRQLAALQAEQYGHDDATQKRLIALESERSRSEKELKTVEKFLKDLQDDKKEMEGHKTISEIITDVKEKKGKKISMYHSSMGMNNTPADSTLFVNQLNKLGDDGQQPGHSKMMIPANTRRGSRIGTDSRRCSFICRKESETDQSKFQRHSIGLGYLGTEMIMPSDGQLLGRTTQSTFTHDLLEDHEKRLSADGELAYYNLLANSERMLMSNDSEFETTSTHGALSTLNRSKRRKTLAMEAILKQLPSYKKKQQTGMDPLDALNCRYLRLTNSNIRDLERQCHENGYEAELHFHKTEQEIEEHFAKLPYDQED